MGTQDKVFDAKVMGKQLKILRKKIGKNQEELAEYLNLSTETISHYERGIRPIPHDIITILCQEFNVSADNFYFEKDKPLDDNEKDSGVDEFTKEMQQCTDFEKKQLMEMLKILRMKPVVV